MIARAVESEHRGMAGTDGVCDVLRVVLKQVVVRQKEIHLGQLVAVFGKEEKRG